MKFVFLDFDGVLHTQYGRDSTLWSLLPRFEAVLRDCRETQVIVSSSWGDSRTLDDLRAFFAEDVRHQIVDKVRTHRVSFRSGRGERAAACERFCRRRRLRSGEWVALDDTSSLFLPRSPLIVCWNGFRQEQELLLRMVLADVIPAWRFAFDAVSDLFNLQFDCDPDATNRYVINDRTERENLTVSQLLFARRRRAVEKHLHLLDALRPSRPPLTDEEMNARHGEMPNYELVDGVLTIVEKRKRR